MVEKQKFFLCLSHLSSSFSCSWYMNKNNLIIEKPKYFYVCPIRCCDLVSLVHDISITLFLTRSLLIAAIHCHPSWFDQYHIFVFNCVFVDTNDSPLLFLLLWFPKIFNLFILHCIRLIQAPFWSRFRFRVKKCSVCLKFLKYTENQFSVKLCLYIVVFKLIQ